jgi:hypothetical protein
MNMKKDIQLSGTKVRKAILSGVVLSAGIASFLQVNAQSNGKAWVRKNMDGKQPLKKLKSIPHDALDGNSGNDLMMRAATPGCAITGTAAAETINFGGSYCDTAFGLAGNDLLYGYSSSTTDTLLFDAGADNDKVQVYSYGPVIGYGGSENDSVLVYTYGPTLIGGDSGDDELFSFSVYGESIVDGGIGNDVVGSYSYGVVVAAGGDNDDQLAGRSLYGLVYATGGTGSDFMLTGSYYGDNFSLGGDGDDYMYGVSVFGYSNFMDGGQGDDVMVVGLDYPYSAGSSPYAYRGSYLYGGTGNDLMLAHVGNDTLVSGGGADVMRSYSGDDMLFAGDDLFVEADGGPGTDDLYIFFSLDMDATSAALLGLERMNIDGAGTNTLSISSSTVVHNATAGINALTGSDSTLVVDGGTDDNVALTGPWTMTGTGTIGANNYDIYETPDLARLWINQDINLILIAVSEKVLSENLTVSPIPTTGPVDLRFVSPASGLMKIQVRDLTGRQLYHEDRFILQGSYEGKLDLTAFPAGVYLLEVQMGDARTTRKLVVE